VPTVSVQYEGRQQPKIWCLDTDQKWRTSQRLGNTNSGVYPKATARRTSIVYVII